MRTSVPAPFGTAAVHPFAAHRRFALAERMQRRDEIGGDDFTVAARDGGFDRLLEHVRRPEQHVHDLGIDDEILAAHAIEHGFELVRELGDDGVPHRRTHAFDRVDGAENGAHRPARPSRRSSRARARAAPG
jgi:hypothetical protein